MLAEWALGEPVNEFAGTEWMERGKILEPEARQVLRLSMQTRNPQRK